MSIIRPLHVGISVGDMDASLAWYEKNLGFTLVDDEYVPPLGARICFIQNGDFQLELFRYDEPQALPEDRRHPDTDLRTIGTKHVAFEVADYPAVKERFLANGVDIAHEAVMAGNNVMFIRDNSGVLLELIQNNG